MNANERVFFPFISEWWEEGERGEGAFSLGLLRWEQACAGGYAWGLSPAAPLPPEGDPRAHKSLSPESAWTPLDSPSRGYSLGGER